MFSNQQFLAVLIFYIGSIVIPVISYIILLALKLHDYIKECNEIVFILQKCDYNKLSINDYCWARSFDCTQLRDEQSYQLQLLAAGVLFGGFYIYAGWDSPMQDLIIYLIIAILFPIVVSLILISRTRRFSEDLGKLKGLADYCNNNRE